MEQIPLDEIINAIEELSNISIALIITAYKEPNIGKAIESAVKQKLERPYRIIVSVPDDETCKIVKMYQEKYPNIQLYKDPGNGKSYALNLLLKRLKESILIFTDGDVFLGNNSLKELINLFNEF